MNTRCIIPLTVLFAACANDEWVDAGHLESHQIEVTEAFSLLGLDTTGTLSASGGGRDWSLSVPSGEDTIDIDVHSPGEFDLAAFDGREVRVRLGSDPEESFAAMRPMAIQDGDDLLYLAADGDAWDADDFLTLVGRSFVSHGEEAGGYEEGGYNFHWTDVDVATDDGIISVVPGDVETITVSGVQYRFVAIASYTVEDDRGTDCIGLPPILAFEMQRVEAPVSGHVERLEGEQFARGMDCEG